MASTTPLGALGALFRIESSKHESVAAPPAALRRDEHAGNAAPSAYELEHLISVPRHESTKAPGPSIPPTPNGIRTPAELDEVDIESRPASPAHAAAEIVPSLNNPPKNKVRYGALLGIFLATGMNDASLGALIPYMEVQYDVSYGVIAMIFVTNAIGFLVAAPVIPKVQKILGRGKLLALSQICMMVGYLMIVFTPPFAVVCIAFFFLGFGMAVSLAPNFVFMANLTNASTILGVCHGTYGIGGILGPLIATAMTNSGRKWSSFYAILIAICAINTVSNFWFNRDYETDKPDPHLAAIQLERLSSHHRRNASRSQTSHGRINDPTDTTTPRDPLTNSNPANTPAEKRAWRRTLSRTTMLSALFIFAYQGAEVSVSGWILSFLLAYRSGSNSTKAVPTAPSAYDPLAPSAGVSTGSIGYVTSGFFGGITLGRLLLVDPLASLLGEFGGVALLVALASLFQLLVWLLPNLVAESISIAILGLILGPVYPLATIVFARYLDRRAQVSSLAVITALGSSGGAVAPFITGIVSQGVGVWVLHPICLVLYAGMGACWLGLGWGRVKRRE